jgi:2-phosphosulfolactate phosphatase
MDPFLHVYSLPSAVSPEELAGGSVVVIDVLRASTTILYALAAGALEVIPCLEVDDALSVASKSRSAYILGGERGGLPIDGFDLGNSPTDYTPDRVRGKALVFTTTNGTRAMMRCRQAGRVAIGAFVNAAAVVEWLRGQEQVHLICAGSTGRVSRDDILFAGMLVERLQRQGLVYSLNAQAITARENWIASFAIPYTTGAEPLPRDLLSQELRTTIAGQKLVSVGLANDILTAAEIDTFQSVPELDVVTFRIRVRAGK